MKPVKLSWQERRSNSSFIESVWTSTSLTATSRAIIADPCICIALIAKGDQREIVIAGPKTKPKQEFLPAGYVCTTIRLKPGVFLKNFSTSGLVDRTITIPVFAENKFWFEGTLFHFPDFDKAEQLVETLFVNNHLDFKSPMSFYAGSRRTSARHTRQSTGLPPHKLYQLQRMHHALRLLKQGVSAVDVAVELAFTDQSHLAHTAKRFLGYTPRQLSHLPQNP